MLMIERPRVGFPKAEKSNESVNLPHEFMYQKEICMDIPYPSSIHKHMNNYRKQGSEYTNYILSSTNSDRRCFLVYARMISG